LEFPDPMVGWIPAARRAVRGRRFDVVLATTPPFTAAVLGRRLAESMRAKLVLDYRDPWTESPGLVANEEVSEALRARHRRLEDRGLKRADLVVGVSRTICRWLEGRTSSPVAFIPNAFDPAAAKAPIRSEGELVYLGSLSYGRSLGALLRIAAEAPDLGRPVVAYAGPHGAEFRRQAAAAGASGRVRDLGEVSRADALAVLRGAKAGVVVVSDRYGYTLPGKMFDVIAADRPILLLGPSEAEASVTVRRHGLGWSHAPADDDGLRATVRAILDGARPQAADLGDFDAAVLGDRLDRELRALVRA
jgi:hypothetical protein